MSTHLNLIKQVGLGLSKIPTGKRKNGLLLDIEGLDKEGMLHENFARESC